MRPALQQIVNNEIKDKIPLKSSKASDQPNIVQSLQGLQKIFTRRDTQFQSVQQQVDEIKRQQSRERSCQSLSPKKKIASQLSENSPIQQQILNSQKLETLNSQNQSEIKSQPLLSHKNSQINLQSTTKPPSNRKFREIQQADFFRTKQEPVEDWKEKYYYLQKQLGGRIEQLEKQLEDVSKTQFDEIIQENVKLKSQLQNVNRLIDEKDSQIQLYSQNIQLLEKKVLSQSQQLMNLIVERDNMSLKIAEFERNGLVDVKKFQQIEKDYNRVKQQIPYLQTAMANMKNIFDQIQEVPQSRNNVNQFVQNQNQNQNFNQNLTISSVSMVEMYNDFKELNLDEFGSNLNGPHVQQIQGKQIQIKQDSVESEGNLTRGRKSISLTQIIQKHLSKREQ
ncbi:hypothetical protein pb186bvf_009345 [Paramecium bursaria]